MATGAEDLPAHFRVGNPTNVNLSVLDPSLVTATDDVNRVVASGPYPASKSRIQPESIMGIQRVRDG
jgi:hypothetical protein